MGKLNFSPLSTDICHYVVIMHYQSCEVLIVMFNRAVYPNNNMYVGQWLYLGYMMKERELVNATYV